MDNGRFTILLLLIIILGGGSAYYAYDKTTDLQASVDKLETRVLAIQNGIKQINDTANLSKSTADAAQAAVNKLVAQAAAAQQAADAAAAAATAAKEAASAKKR
jgi:predicted  nucleic acid-binding Zn-ribbon protein